ncbi:MAG: hypothetical protein M0P71_18520 [Melioribacteraceae bacterium]|jgi:hypothetical protein|nr:hypothetical protein [Melioribacteraceae bacterium]
MTQEQIRSEVNNIIESLKKDDFDNEAINWADLKVNEVKTEINVIIDEADPDSYNFRSTIENLFLQKFGIEINVITEW